MEKQNKIQQPEENPIDLKECEELLQEYLKCEIPDIYYADLLNETNAIMQIFMKEDMMEIIKTIKNDYFIYTKFLKTHLPKLQEAYSTPHIDIQPLINELHQQTKIFTNALMECHDAFNIIDEGLFPDDMAKLKDQILVDLELEDYV